MGVSECEYIYIFEYERGIVERTKYIPTSYGSFGEHTHTHAHTKTKWACVCGRGRKIKVVKEKYVLYRGKSINTLFIALPFGTNDHLGRLTVHTIHILNEAIFYARTHNHTITHRHRHRDRHRHRRRVLYTHYTVRWKQERKKLNRYFMQSVHLREKFSHLLRWFFSASSDPDEIDSNFLFCNRVCAQLPRGT